MSFPRGTTPTFTLTFDDPDLDLTQAQNVYVTFAYRNSSLTKTGESLTVAEKSIDVYLTQAETLEFPIGDIKVQANWTTASGGRTASEIVSYKVTEQLLNEVIA